MEGKQAKIGTRTLTWGKVLKRKLALFFIGFCLVAIENRSALAQIPATPAGETSALQKPASSADQPQDPAAPTTVAPAQPGADGKGSPPNSPQPKIQVDDSQLAPQTKRILWIIPNFRSVSASTHLPPLATKEKFWLATQDSFDYSAFVWVGMVAGIAMEGKSQPSFGQGASGYGIYYAHNFADNTIENYLVEAVMPTVTKEDPRYYTLGHGGFFKRTGYSLSRLFITRNDSGRDTLNISEIVGAGAAAGISNAYYPAENTWVKTYQRWGSQLVQDAIGFAAREFWPDINRAVFRSKY